MTFEERRREASYYQIPRWREIAFSVIVTPIFFLPHLAFPYLCDLWNIVNWADKLFFGYMFVVFGGFALLLLVLLGVAIETGIRHLSNPYDGKSIIYDISHEITWFFSSMYMMVITPYPKKWYFLNKWFRPNVVAEDLLRGER